MEKIRAYDQYVEVLSDFKKGRARCRTNKVMMREELAALIDSGKLLYEEINGTIWFFSNEDYYYYAHMYAPKDTLIQMRGQDKDVLVELMGKDDRYDGQMERELVEAGYRKGDKYLELGMDLEDKIDDITRQNNIMHKFWEKRGYTYRKATREDYPELRKQWLEGLGRESYNVKAMTDAELEEMERHGRCSLICDPRGKIVSSCIYLKNGQIAYGYIAVTSQKGSGLGAGALCDAEAHEYEEGCVKQLVWVREDNSDSLSMNMHMSSLTGKIFRQFVFKS